MGDVPVIHAVAAALVDKDKRVLIARRPEEKFMGGFWEFPGGKVEAGETPEEALRREAEEEIGVKLGCMGPMSFISEKREDHHAVVMVYVCREWDGIPEGKEGQYIKWVRPLQMKQYDILPSNIPLIPILRDFIR